jgi:hypothetical protein
MRYRLLLRTSRLDALTHAVVVSIPIFRIHHYNSEKHLRVERKTEMKVSETRLIYEISKRGGNAYKETSKHCHQLIESPRRGFSRSGLMWVWP